MGADFAQNPNRFKPAMPQIPGISVPKPPAKETGGQPRWILALRIAIPLAGALAVGAVVAWWTLGRPRATAKSPAPEVETQHVSAPAPEGPARVATLAELARPWSAKRFFFHKPFTNELVVAIVVRLPGGAANRSASYWAFSLQSLSLRANMAIAPTTRWSPTPATEYSMIPCTWAACRAGPGLAVKWCTAVASARRWASVCASKAII